MPKRYLSSVRWPLQIKLFSALKATFREGYRLDDLRADVLAGIVVALVAIPLGMALAIASGVQPENGLYTVIVGGAIVAALGGSRFQVTGPTAAFIVILAPIVHAHGVGGLLLAGLMAGLMLVIAGLLGLGRLIQYIPYPVTTGFTSGIAVVIATLQLKDFLGLRVAGHADTYFQHVSQLARSLPSLSLAEALVGALTLAFILLWPRFNKRIPAPIVALGAMSVLVALAEMAFPSLSIATVGSRFNGIPQGLPSLAWPWARVGELPGFQLSLSSIQDLLPSAFAIAMLGAIESLLSAVVADGMAQSRHDPDAELTALGVGNIVGPFLGAIPATGALARTATNIRYGARSPIAAITHSLFVLLVVLFLAPFVSYLPMASLAALLLVVANNMLEAKHFVHILRVAPRSDAAVLLACFSLTVVFDMVIGVTTGVIMAAFLFMKRMTALVSGRELRVGEARSLPEPVPGVVVYEIAGPLFFGAAEKAMDALGAINPSVRAVIFVLERVPVMDVSGLVALESAVKKLSRHKRLSILACAQPQPLELLERSLELRASEWVAYTPDLAEAMDVGRGFVENPPRPGRAGAT